MIVHARRSDRGSVIMLVRDGAPGTRFGVRDVQCSLSFGSGVDLDSRGSHDSSFRVAGLRGDGDREVPYRRASVAVSG